MMRTRYDPETDALYIQMAPDGVPSDRTDEVVPGLFLDFDAAGVLIGVEILDPAARSVEAASDKARVTRLIARAKQAALDDVAGTRYARVAETLAVEPKEAVLNPGRSR